MNKSMVKESVYRSPKWLRKYIDFEISTGDDISDKSSILSKEREIKKKWNKRWISSNKEDFIKFFGEVYSEYVSNNLRGYVMNSDLKDVKSDFEGDLEIWDKFDDWLEKKKKKEETRARLEKEISDIEKRLMSDFRGNPYRDKLRTYRKNGHVCFEYTFENGDKFKICNDQIEYGNKVYTVGLVYRNKFVEIANFMTSNDRVRRRKESTNGPKRTRYNDIKSKIKLREEQIRGMSDSDPNKEQLANELDNYKLAAKRMKDKYKFEHLSGFDNFDIL